VATVQTFKNRKKMSIYKILKKPFFGNFMVKWKNPLTKEQSKEWKPIETDSKTGGKIIGLFANARQPQPKATIVLGHPMGKEAKGYFLKNGYTELLLDNGYNVLVFDINGFGESTHGNFSYFYDIVAISQKAKELTPNLPIGYHGISLGGMWATISFADETHCYDFAILESAATSLEEFWLHFRMANRMLKMLGVLMPKYKQQVRMIDRIKEAKKLKSILFIYSQTDDWTPVSMGERFQKNSGVKSELWTVANAKHASIMKSDHKEAYKQKILNYFDQSTLL
jgi:alpha-beta hydrolase superfamily lysophospholipase